MNPVGVPDTIVSDFARNFWGLSLDQIEPGSRDVARQAIGAVLPRLESLVRAHIAAEAKDTMTPATVPGGLVDMGVTVFEDQAHENCGEDEGRPGNTRPYHESLMREALAEILPEYGKQVREQVAQAIEADSEPAPWSLSTSGVNPAWIDSRDCTKAAAIARSFLARQP